MKDIVIYVFNFRRNKYNEYFVSKSFHKEIVDYSVSNGQQIYLLNIFEHLDARIRMCTVSMLLMNVHLCIYTSASCILRICEDATFDARKNILFFIPKYDLQTYT
jgi:hypothetical protein